jgi:hypothetical protein
LKTILCEETDPWTISFECKYCKHYKIGKNVLTISYSS